MGDGRFPIKRQGVEGELTRAKPVTRQTRSQIDGGPSEDDLERFGGVTRTCPSCGKEVYDDAALCYHCGEAMEQDRTAKLPKVWMVVTVIVLIAVIVFFVTR